MKEFLILIIPDSWDRGMQVAHRVHNLWIDSWGLFHRGRSWTAKSAWNASSLNTCTIVYCWYIILRSGFWLSCHSTRLASNSQLANHYIHWYLTLFMLLSPPGSMAALHHPQSSYHSIITNTSNNKRFIFCLIHTHTHTVLLWREIHQLKGSHK